MFVQSRVHVALPATDLGRARRFYAEKLGLTPTQERADGLTYDFGDGPGVLLFPTSISDRGGHTQAGIEVPDVEAAVAELESRGVAFEEYDAPAGGRGGVAAAPRRADRRRPCAVALPAAVPGRVAADDRTDDAAVELAPRADVWSAFGAAALVFDVGVHAAVESSSWLHEHEWLLGGSVLALAGAFQFTALKDACLDKCRHPAQFLLRFYERGAPGGLRLGGRHGVYCVGCCWALMLVMFTVGVASLVWMAVLTAVMLWEKTRPSGARSVPVTGVGLLSAASVVLAYAVYAN